MNRFDWLSELLARFQDEHIFVFKGSSTRLAPAHIFHLDQENWSHAATQAAHYGCRWCALWAEEICNAEQERNFLINACYEHGGDYLVLRSKLPYQNPKVPSLTPVFPAANRVERHIQDLFGILFIDHPDKRNWTRHQAWQADQYPLRKTFPTQGTVTSITPADKDYPFVQAQGAGVYEIPVGPVHAGIIEPGHFRFQAVGEHILNLEEHLGYVHKGIEKIAEGRDAQGLARLAARVSGDTTVGHTWAACMAMERATKLTIPPRALVLRAIMAERERIANHLGDVGAICNDVGFGFAYYQFGRLRELWLRQSKQGFGHRFMMDCIIPGGVKADLEAAKISAQIQQTQNFDTELHELEDILERHTGLEDRLATTGILTKAQATQLGCLGYVGRASGLTYDVRRNSPYSPYDQFCAEIPVFTNGDVEARVHVRLAEIHVSLHLLYQLLNQLPAGEIATPWIPPTVEVEGLGIVEGWRGEIITHIRFDATGKIARYYPRDPSWHNWPALELLIRDNIVPDFPVCNKSVNGSYSGQDL